RRDDNEQCSSGSHSSAYRGSHYHAPTYPSLSTSSFRAFLLPSSILLFCELWAGLLLTKRKLHLLPSLKMHRAFGVLSCALVAICAFAATTTMTDPPAMTNLLALPMPTPFMLFMTCSSSTRDDIEFAKSFVQQWIKLGPDFIFFSASLMAEGTFGL